MAEVTICTCAVDLAASPLLRSFPYNDSFSLASRSFLFQLDHSHQHVNTFRQFLSYKRKKFCTGIKWSSGDCPISLISFVERFLCTDFVGADSVSALQPVSVTHPDTAPGAMLLARSSMPSTLAKFSSHCVDPQRHSTELLRPLCNTSLRLALGFSL